MTHPHDHLAQQVTRAFHDGDLDTLITTLHHHALLHGRPAQLISNLKPLFTAAQRDHINLLHPPPDLHTWLHTTLQFNQDGTPSKPNTRNSRLVALRALYRALRHLRLITGDPLLDYHGLPSERRADPLPSRAHLDQLLHASQHDPNLHAALLLVWHHALPIATLLRLRWAAYAPQPHTLLRGDLITTLSPDATRALDRLHHRAGYDPLYADTLDTVAPLRIFPYDTQDALRLRILQVAQQAGLDFIPPGLIKRAALRDHASTAQQLGYRHEREFENATRHAQRVANATRPPQT